MDTDIQRFLDHRRTAGALPGCVSRLNQNDDPTSVFSFVRGVLDQLTPGRIRNALGQTMILKHILDPQILKGHQAEGVCQCAAHLMCEIPSNVILAEEFAKRFDGFSIGSNDLTQLTLGIDRDSHLLSALFDEEDAAVKTLITDVIARAHKSGAHVGLCGQAPSDHPGFARFLVEAGIDSMSVTPDSFLAVKRNVAAAEAKTKD